MPLNGYRKIGNTKNIDVKKYFLYRHIRLDKNVPFYIGIGVNNKKTTRTRYYERAFQKDSRNNWWKRIASKSKYEVEIIWESDDEHEIREKEKEFILLYGRKDLSNGTLVNLTDGGDGALNCSVETRKKLSVQKIGNRNGANQVYTYERRKAIGDRFRGNKTWLGKKRKRTSVEQGAAKIRGVEYTEDRRLKVNGTHPNSKQVKCLENGVTYNSIGECIRLLFNCSLLAKENKYRVIKHGISKVCNNKLTSYKRFHFKFI